MRYGRLAGALPRFLRRYIMDFERRIDDAVAEFAAGLPEGSWVLDAGAGETRHAGAFRRQRYVAVDLAVGDPGWDYSRLDCVADLTALPFRDGGFSACLNVVTLEHVPEPQRVVAELFRVLAPGGRLLLIVPASWEIHQAPHDYYRYTRYGVEYLIRSAGGQVIRIEPMGGFFRLLSRRLLNALSFFPLVLAPVVALLVAPAALLAPLFDGLDRNRTFTLGYVCTAEKPS